MNAYSRALGLLSCVLPFCAAYLLGQQSSNEQTKFAETPNTTLAVTVTDRDHRPVTGLSAENFTLYIDGQKQTVNSVTSGDVPACVGILVDKSGSMRGKHAAIAAGVGEFVRAGNPGNQYFVVLFNDDASLQQDFTGDAALVEQAISRADPRGGTAFYDSVIATADHLAEGKTCQKRALLLVSDGVDNESRKTLEYTLHALQEDGNPFVYAIGSQEKMSSFAGRGKHALEALTAPSGGNMVLTNDYRDFRKIAQKLAEELRAQYTITFNANGVSANPEVKVLVHSPDRKELVARVNFPRTVKLPAKPSANQAHNSGCIDGSVLDEDKKPVAGINVEAWPTFAPNSYAKDSYPSTVTDEHGKFKIEALEKGSYLLYTKNESAGYAPTNDSFYRNATLPLTQVSGKCTKVEVRVGPKAARLKIHVIEAGTGTPLSRFGISFRDHLGILVISSASQNQEVMVPANMELTVSAWSYGYPRSQPITVTTPGPEASQDVSIQLSPRAAASAGSDH